MVCVGYVIRLSKAINYLVPIEYIPIKNWLTSHCGGNVT